MLMLLTLSVYDFKLFGIKLVAQLAQITEHKLNSSAAVLLLLLLLEDKI